MSRTAIAAIILGLTNITLLLLLWQNVSTVKEHGEQEYKALRDSIAATSARAEQAMARMDSLTLAIGEVRAERQNIKRRYVQKLDTLRRGPISGPDSIIRAALAR